MEGKSNTSKRTFNWPNAVYLVVTPFLAIPAVIIWLKLGLFNWNTIILMTIIGTLAQLSITGGYHRLFAHRTYNAAWPVRLFFLVFGAAAFEGPALLWSLDHREHHNYVDDEEKDPYAITKGFFWAHMGWLLFKKDDQLDRSSKVGDLFQDPLVMWQYKHWVWVGAVVTFVLPTLIAWTWGDPIGGFLIAGLVRSVTTHHCTFSINSLAHYWGKQTYSDKHSSRDNLFTALLTFGEGYHNYHHEFPSDYRNGPRFYDWDPTKWIIKALSYFGLTYNLKTIRKEIIVRKRMQMKEKHMRNKLEHSGFNQFGSQEMKILDNLKANMEKAFKQLSQLREEHKGLSKKHVSDKNFVGLELDVLQDQIRDTLAEFLSTAKQWNIVRRRVLAYARV